MRANERTKERTAQCILRLDFIIILTNVQGGDPMNEFTFTIPGQTPHGGAATSPNQNVQFKSGAPRNAGGSGSGASRRSKRRRPPKTCISAPAAIFIFLFGGIVFLLGVIFTSCYVAQAFPPLEYGAVFVALG